MMNRVRIQFWVRIALGVAVVCLLGASARYALVARRWHTPGEPGHA
jgi:hypothetical protein